MLYSKLFSKTRKSIKEYDTKNAKLLEQGGFVTQLMAGVYSYLPLGLRVLRKIEEIVRKGMNEIGGTEILMPILHPSENWKATGGWDSIDVLFKIKSRTGREYAIGQSEEEIITPIFKEFVKSYKDLPFLPYQIHWKFRDELRAKSGIMRGREFLMKDMYSLHETQEEFDEFYSIIKKKYIEIFKKMGLEAKATEASGGSFSKKISYEFMVLTDAGEDDILYSANSDYCINVEISSQKEGDIAKDGSGILKKGRASEVGNVFDLGTRYQECFDFSFVGRNGERKRGIMGCYGIGISRLMGVIVEKFNDEKGIVWPESVAPFQFHIVGLDFSDEKVRANSFKIYEKLLENGVDVLFDDRIDVSAGEKFADSDLIGIPTRIVLSKKTKFSDENILESEVEVKKRNEKDIKFCTLKSLIF